MARHKTSPVLIQAKTSLAERLRGLRDEMFGERGGPEMARRLEVPIRTWYNYESGVTIPAEVVLRVIEMLGVEPLWLLHGTGAKHRIMTPTPEVPEAASAEIANWHLREALRILDDRGVSRRAVTSPHLHGIAGDGAEVAEGGSAGQTVFIEVDESTSPNSTSETSRGAGPRFVPAPTEWIEDVAKCRCVRVDDASMTPIVLPGGCVGYSDVNETVTALSGELVVATRELDAFPVVRWFEASGRFALLRAENSELEPAPTVVELADESRPKGWRLRRVLWISTQH